MLNIFPEDHESPQDSASLLSQAEQLFSLIPPTRLDLFARQLQAAASDQLRDYLLHILKTEVQSGAWGVVDQCLPIAIASWNEYPGCVEFKQTVEALACLSPSWNIGAVMLERPEELQWWGDLLRLLPLQSLYPSSVFECIHGFRNQIIDKSLQVGNFLKIQQFPQERLETFLYLLHLEQLNEDAGRIRNSLEKAFEQLQLLLDTVQRLEIILQSQPAGLMDAAAIQQTAREYLDGFLQKSLRDSMPPAALTQVLQAPFRRTIEVWLYRILPDMRQSHVILPIAISDFIESNEPQRVLSEKEALVHFQLKLLQLSFPQVLLFSETSQEPGELKLRLIRDWYQSHSLSFDSYLREVFYRDRERLVCVFTRDLQDAQMSFDLENVRVKGNDIRSIEELYTSVGDFMKSAVQRLLVLDYFMDFPCAVDIKTAKKALEEADSQFPQTSKLLCLLVRLSADYPPIEGVWPKQWTLISFENLSEPFSASLKSLQKWLHCDTHANLVHLNYTSSCDRVEAILRTSYQNLAAECLDEIKILANNPEFRGIISEKLRKEAIAPADWKVRALQRNREWFLRDRVEQALIEIAGELLGPAIRAVKRYQAFPSFLNAGENSLVRKLWKATFLTLVPDNSEPQARPQVPLHYPFVLKDYDYLIGTGNDLATYLNLSVTTLHMEVDTATVRELLTTYLEDLAVLDLAEATYGEQGKAVFACLCKEKYSFMHLVQCYLEHREPLLALCWCKSCPLLDDFFADIMGRTPQGDIHINPRHLSELIKTKEEELSYQQNPTVRLFTLEQRLLLMFNCPRKRIIRNKLSSPMKSHRSSLILVNRETLFSCGGVEDGLIRDSISPQTCTVQLLEGFRLIQQKIMKKARYCHGLAVISEHTIYAIGGSDGPKFLRSIEKFSREAGDWSNLSSSLRADRANFTPLVYKDIIYLIGGHATEVETIDPSSDSLSTCGLTLPRTESCIGLFAGEGKVLVISENKVCKVDLEGRQCREREGKGTPVGSVYPPVLHDRQVYIVDEKMTFRWLSQEGELIKEEPALIA